MFATHAQQTHVFVVHVYACAARLHECLTSFSSSLQYCLAKLAVTRKA